MLFLGRITSNYLPSLFTLHQENRILIVEDHSTVRIGIKYMLNNILPQSNIVMAENFEQAIKIISGETFDLIILDLNIPGGDAPTMIRRIRDLQKNVRILIFSGYDEQIYALPYLQAGADGYLSKNAPDHEFSAAVKSVLNNRKYLSNDMQQQAINRIVSAPNDVAETNPANILSAREVEVMQLLLKGLGTAEIGAQLHLQLSTISTYKMKIFEKLGVKNIVELVEKMKNYQE